MHEVGDVVVWSGYMPCIARVLSVSKKFNLHYKLSASAWHEICHYSRLRPATDSEKTLLGESDVYWLEGIQN